MTEVCEICGDEVGEWQMVTKDYMTLDGQHDTIEICKECANVPKEELGGWG